MLKLWLDSNPSEVTSQLLAPIDQTDGFIKNRRLMVDSAGVNMITFEQMFQEQQGISSTTQIHLLVAELAMSPKEPLSRVSPPRAPVARIPEDIKNSSGPAKGSVPKGVKGEDALWAKFDGRD